MNKIFFGVAILAFGVLGWLYQREMSEVSATKAAVTAAADSTAATLSNATAPERSTDADADRIFKSEIKGSPLFDTVSVRQSLQTLPSGQRRQTVTVFGRARTNMSNNIGLQGAELEVVGTHDFGPKK